MQQAFKEVMVQIPYFLPLHLLVVEVVVGRLETQMENQEDQVVAQGRLIQLAEQEEQETPHRPAHHKATMEAQQAAHQIPLGTVAAVVVHQQQEAQVLEVRVEMVVQEPLIQLLACLLPMLVVGVVALILMVGLEHLEPAAQEVVEMVEKME